MKKEKTSDETAQPVVEDTTTNAASENPPGNETFFDDSQYAEVPTDEEKTTTGKASDEPIQRQFENPNAPFGFEADGITPKAPYGYHSRTGKIKLVSGRPTDKSSGGEPLPPKLKKDDESDLFAYLKTEKGAAQIKETKIEPKAEPKAEAVPNTLKKHRVFITGAMFLFALDMLVPNVIAGCYNFFAPDLIKADDLKLTPKEREELGALADEVVEELLNRLSPLEQFMFYTGILYGSKVAWAPKTPKLKKGKKEAENV